MIYSNFFGKNHIKFSCGERVGQEPPLCGSAEDVPHYGYLRLRPLCGLCLRLTFGLAATRLPGAMRLPFQACTINGIEKPFLLDKPQKIWFCSRLMRIFDCVLYTLARQNSNKFGSALDLCVYLTASYILSLGRTQINLVLLSTYAYI